MRNIYKYSLVAFALLAMAGCEQKEISGGDDVIINVETPEYGYIFFDSMLRGGTRGTLINPDGPDDLPLEADFGVIGYTYVANDWTTAEVQARPNVFNQHPLKVTWDSSELMHTYDNDGGGSDDLVPWLGKQKYAFFAYYPYGNGKVVPSGSEVEGNPYIDFTLPSRTSVADHIDVMTAHNIDADYTVRSVGFRMEHRLTAIDVIANNLYKDKDVVVKNVTVAFDNLLYDKVRIPLNMRDEEDLQYPDGMVAGDDRKASYPVLSSDKGVSVDTNTYLTGEDNNTIIIIPQNQYIDTDNDGTTEDCTTGTISGSVRVGDLDDAFEVAFAVNRDLLSGHRYYILLNFSDGDVNVVVIESDKWAERDDIKYDFE
ncbi:MAG: fimbrillin family protein [Alistipes sp.]|nr:fimbrillin family protein [Alistipes sp.]